MITDPKTGIKEPIITLRPLVDFRGKTKIISSNEPPDWFRKVMINYMYFIKEFK